MASHPFQHSLRAFCLLAILFAGSPSLHAQVVDPLAASLDSIKALARDVQSLRDNDKLAFEEQEAKVKAASDKLNAVRNPLLQKGLSSEQIMKAIYYAPNEISFEDLVKLNLLSADLLKAYRAGEQRDKTLTDRNIEHEFDQRSWHPYVAPGQDVLPPIKSLVVEDNSAALKNPAGREQYLVSMHMLEGEAPRAATMRLTFVRERGRWLIDDIYDAHFDRSAKAELTRFVSATAKLLNAKRQTLKADAESRR